MQWTAELSALLNQCAFSAGYDFAETCAALKPRAARMRVDSDALTAEACEAQWMLLNPVMEDDEADGPEHNSVEEEEDPCGWMLEGLAVGTTSNSLSPLRHELDGLHIDKVDEHRVVEASGDPCSACQDPDNDSDIVAWRSTPRLELSISDAELDELLRELPVDVDPAHCDAKNSDGVKSEMQWVLAFLTDPETAAITDVEAKQFAAAASASDIHSDDNYKGFLKDLDDVNLLVSSPKKRQLKASTTRLSAIELDSHGHDDVQPAAEDEEDSDSDTDEWISTRHRIKQRSGGDSTA